MTQFCAFEECLTAGVHGFEEVKKRSDGHFFPNKDRNIVFAIGYLLQLVLWLWVDLLRCKKCIVLHTES